MWESGSVDSCGLEIRDGDKVVKSLRSDRDDMHEVRVDDLATGHRYQYIVDCGGERLGGEFATAPEATEPFMFVVFGDSRSNPGSHRNVVERVRREVADFILGTGDFVNQGGVEGDWQSFFDVEGDLLRDNVLFPSVGNHDRQGRGRTADNYRKYFAVPENSPNPERYYAFTYGNSRFLILDSNAYSFALTDQTAWIEAQLQAARLDKSIRHIFVAMHHPPYSVSLHGGHEQLRDAWTPLYEKYGVDAVFSGHDHNYQRADVEGVKYFVSGGGGAPLYPRSKRASDRDVEAVKYMERANHYLRVHVIGDYVEVTAFRTDGTVMESVSWGSLPANPDSLVALAVGAGEPAAGSTADDTDDVASVKASPGAGDSRFGPLGILGGAMMLLAAGLIVWTVRQ